MAENPNPAVLMQQKYIECCNLPVEKKCILLESNRGRNFAHSLQVMAKILCGNPEFSGYTVYGVCTGKNQREQEDFFEWIGAAGVQPVVFASEEYIRLLATAGTLISTGPLPNHYIKREEQIYLNLWEDIPVRKGGRYAKETCTEIADIQRNLLCADYLVCPNEFTMKRIAEDYMLSNIGKTKVLYGGRFQCEALLAKEEGQNLRKKHGLDHKKVVLYLPEADDTGFNAADKEKTDALWKMLCDLDKRLAPDVQVLVSVPHNLKEHYEFSCLHQVCPVPRNCNKVQALSMADVLVTAGSDAVFDFAATGKKIILYSHNENKTPEQYFELQESLPFAKATGVEELVAQIESEKEYEDREFKELYCKYLIRGNAERILNRVLLSETCPELSEDFLPDNGKTNVLIYPGPLFKNGITSAILSLLDHLDREKNNYILYVRTEHIQEAGEVLERLPEGVAYYAYRVARALTAEEDPVYEAWNNEPEYSYETAKPVLYRRMEREKQRLLDFLRIDTVIHYEGYGRDILFLFELMPCRRIIYLHNHMLQEVEKKGIRPEPLCHAYHAFDVVALVSEDQRPVAEQMIAMDGGDPEKANIVLAKNVILYEQVLSRSKEEFQLDPQTEISVTEAKLRELLASGKKKFVTIGRFLPEKGHDRLIRAFEKIHKEYPETALVILGGYGYLYEDTVQWAKDSAAAENIAVIKYLSNPYALLAACDYFVLSSHYEGFGLVLAEADIAGIPCFSTKITGPTGFLGQYGGLLVEDSEDGIVDGMLQCLHGQVPKKLTVDYLEYNKEAVCQFEAMLPERIEG